MKKRCLNCGSIHLSSNNNECLSCGELLTNKLQEELKINYSSDKIYSYNINKIVSIHTNLEKGVRYGTGIIVNGYIITNAHVVNELLDENKFSPSDNILVFNNDEKTANCEFIYYDESLDLAIYKLEKDLGKGYNLIEDISETFIVGEKVFTIGNALGKGLTITDGIIGSETRNIDGYKRIVMTNSITNGNSGGPLINTKNQLVGIVFAGETKGYFINYTISIKDVVEFIKKVEKMEDVKIL